MIITSARSSFFNAFDLCEHQAFLIYCLGQHFPSNHRAELGSVFHLVAELIANFNLCQKNNTKELYNDAIGKVEVENYDQLYDWTFLNSLTRKSFDYYKNKSQNTFTEKEYAEVQGWVKLFLSYKDGMFDPRKREIIAAEKFFDLPVEEGWGCYNFPEFGLTGKLRILGTIDLITQVTPTIYEVVDYKTGKKYDWNKGCEKTDEDLRHDIQPRLYHYVLYKLYPHIKQFLLTFFYLKAGPTTLVFDEGDKKHTEELIKEKFNKIKNTARPRLKSNENLHFFCKRVCEAYKKSSPCPGKNYCQYIRDKISAVGLNQTIKEEKNPDFSFGNYVQS